MTAIPVKGEPALKIKAENIHKSFGEVNALCGLNLEIEEGILGLLGPNGAGKTTFIRILTGLSFPDAGQVTIGDSDMFHPKKRRAVLSKIGYLPQTFGVPPRINALEFLNFMAHFYSDYHHIIKKRSRKLLELVGLWEYRNTALTSYSGGMKRRLGIAQALLNDPVFLIVDEPTAGLDPEERISFRNILSDLPGDRLIILSTHIVEDIEITCNKLAIMEKGRIGFLGTPADLFQEMMPFIWEKGSIRDDATETTDERIISIRQDGPYRIFKKLSLSQPPGYEKTLPIFEDVYIAWLRRRSIEKSL